MGNFNSYLNDRLEAARATAPSTGDSAVPVEGAVGFDPSAHSLAKVLAHVEANPTEKAAVLAAEIAGKARKGVVSALS
jgi:hypothetical protein